MRETKPGYKTTEFWIVILGNVLINLGAIDVGGAKYRGLFAILSVVGYTLARGQAKSGVPDGGFVPQVPIGDEGDLGDDIPPEVTALKPAVYNTTMNVQPNPGVFDYADTAGSATSAGPEPEGVPKPPEPSGD